MRKACPLPIMLQLKRIILLASLFFAVIVPFKLFAQVPTISYNSPQTYTAGAVISPLSPTSTGVAGLLYSSTRLTLGSGFNSPYGVALDATGNIYVADFGHHLVKKMPAGGGATVTLGSGYEGPYGVAVDAAGNIYVADGGNGVKMIPAAGGSQVSVGAGLISSHGVATDPAGNVYVADNGAILKITQGGKQVTLATVSVAFGLAVDAAGNVYVANGSATIQKIPANGGGAPVSIGSGFSNAEGVAVDAAGNIYIADYGHNAIKRMPAGGGAPVSLGTGFTSPYGLALDGAGNVFVAATGNNAVKEMKPVGGYFISSSLPAGLNFDCTTGIFSGMPSAESPMANYTVTAYNSTGSAAAIVNIKVNPSSPPALSISYNSPQIYSTGIKITPLVPVTTGVVAAPGYSNNMASIGSGFSNPAGVAADPAGNIYVADLNNGQVKKIPADGGPPVVIGTFAQPNGVAVDAAGNVYVADGATGIQKIPAGGGSPVMIGSGITNPYSVAVDAARNVFLSDLGDHKVKEIPTAGGPIIVLGTSGELLSPYGVAVDPAGNIYVADLEDNAVKKFPHGGGSWVPVGGVFSVPFGVTTDGAGNVYVTDSGNKQIREIPAGGGSTITIGTGFLNPYGIAADGKGNIYVSDQINNTIREIKPVGGYFITPFLPAGLSFDNGTGIISGTPVAVSPANNYTVTAYNSFAGNSTMVNITVNSLLVNADITALATNAGSLSPVFAPSITSYTEVLPATTSSVTVTPVAAAPGATIKVNGTVVMSGAASAALPLVVGANAINTVVTAQDGTTTKTYTLTVTRLSNNAALTTLKISPLTSLTLVSGADYKDYTTTVPNSETSVKITPTAQDATASIKVNGVATVSGSASAAIPLHAGDNVINTVVTAQDGTTIKTYSIKFTRLPSTNANLAGLALSSGKLSPVFAAGTTSYTATAGTATITVTPTAGDADATIKVNGTAVASGAASAALPLVVGPNVITVVVTASDGTTTKTYTLTVTRLSNNALLTTLKVSPVTTLTVVSGADYKDYTTTVPNSQTSVKVIPTSQDATASIKVNGVTVASGAASAAISLSVGTNVVNTVVTAQDGITVKTYSITFTRQAPGGVVMKYEPQEQPISTDNVTVHQNVSPNGDGNSDVLVIDGIGAYPENKVQIMNRSGVLVYEAKGYDNTTKVFDGHSSTSGKLQQAGTFMYSLEYKDGDEVKHKTGFIVLKY
ncbi:cadherin-like beta sandwich domain-containing protein [Mucilaginibacter sp.]|uniref:cadherin-like beta sandwich domain-containing protein n=1 Tax=Mucilaginibacter sp. TaxID=1882438 RepID=UPI0025CDA86D|nr:cadherin-like beta sandwich domain-containing protein [Mucilaginibacter sp.]